MKKISIVLNIAFLGIIIFFGCEKGTDRSTTTDCPGCRAYERPLINGITYLTAVQMATSYKRAFGGAVGPNDARSAWFSLETLKAFIYQIEKSTCNSGCNLNLGVRIYYGKYPDTIPLTGDLSVLPPSYAARHSLFMVPTYRGATREVNYDFDPWNFIGNPCRPATIDSLKRTTYYQQNSTVRMLSITTYISDTDPLKAVNHGDLIPPDRVDGLAFYFP